MGTLLRSGAILSALLTVGHICFAQTDPKKVPQPPAAELRKFDPFLGKYQVSGDFANVPWTGTLELRKVIKGWYIEQIILVKTEGIDREFRILATWDKNVQKYHLWGFQTLPTMLEGEIRFEGDEMITEWVSARPDGTKATFSNRYRFVSKDELEILSYRQVGNGPAEKIAFLKGKRMLNGEETSASTTDHPPARVIKGSMKLEELSSAEAELRDATAELTRLAGEAGHAYASRHLPTLERLTADDYIQTDVRGGVLNRSQWLEFVKNRKSELTVESDNVQVSFYGSAAVVRGHWTYTSKSDGKDVTSYSRWTSVWTRYPDGWKRHAFQNTYVNANADRCAIEGQQ